MIFEYDFIETQIKPTRAEYTPEIQSVILTTILANRSQKLVCFLETENKNFAITDLTRIK
jgi:hypothetical protein